MWINPANPSHVLTGNDGGIAISYDRAETWDFIDNLPIGQFYRVSYDMDVPYRAASRTTTRGADPARCAIATASATGIGSSSTAATGSVAIVDPNDPSGRAFVHSRTRRGTDYGQTWRSMTNNLLPTHVVRTLTEDHRNPAVLYLGTEFGLFVSLDRGGRWIRLRGANLPTVPIYEISLHPRENDMILGTHGRRIWMITTELPAFCEAIGATGFAPPAAARDRDPGDDHVVRLARGSSSAALAHGRSRKEHAMNRPLNVRRIALAVLIVALVPYAVWAQKRPIVPQDYYRQVSVGEVAVAPSGEYVAFTVTRVVEADNKRHREIWMQRLRNGAPDAAPFRFTDPTEDSSAPRWSPDSSTLSFSSRRGSDRNATWFARVTAPGGEAFHIEGVTAAPIWSPDNQWIAFVRQPERAEDGPSRDPREGWVARDAISKTLDAKRFDGRVITSMRYKRDGTLTFLPDPAIRPATQLYVVAATGGTPRQITRASFDVGSPVWAADSRTLLFTGDETQADERNREPTTDIFAVSIDGGEPRRLTQNPGSETGPSISPKGDRLAFLRTPARGAQTDVMVVDIGPDGAFRGQPRNLTASWDDSPGGLHWRPDGSALRFGAGVRGDAHLFEVSLQGEVRQVTTGSRQANGFSASRDGNVLAYVVSQVTHPSEVYVARGDGTGEQRVTTFNDPLVAELDLVQAEPISWKVADGTAIHGWVMKPVGYTPGRRYPMVLKIHGGPHGAYGTGWFDTFQVLSGAGFFVFYPNPRGSTGYGHAFTYATRGKWGEMDQEDFITGVDAVLAKYPDIDRHRVGVAGGSYGGFMSNWLTARTDRFAASVTSRAISNWESWYGSSDAQGLTEYELLGTPWEQRELYRRLSPISYVEHVTAPTLIIVGEEDYRTPMSDNEQWFIALKMRNVPVEFARYPRSSHGLSRSGEPWLLVDRQERIRSWFVHWLIDKPRTSRSF